MSCIEKMIIQGIRSFGPDDADRQQIDFFSPLTLILGPNGTGKTTIIECLKYITTGDLPPGGKQNAAFIHDPKVAGEPEVKAQVKLMFRDVRGKVYSAQRSITATQKPKKIEMKTLEGVISTKDKSGKVVSISSKCAEMDREMVSLLGVAKPILDSVIFCHQEDANWPLSEGKSLKARFDDIFASTRYVKALDVIRKTAKDQTLDIKLYQSELKHLKHYKEKAAEIQGDIDENEMRYLSCTENVDSIVKKLKPILDQLEIIRTRGQEIYKIQTNIEKMDTEISQIEKSQVELRRNIKKEFKGSVNELKQTLKDFESKVHEKEDILRNQEEEVAGITNDLEDVSDNKAVLLVDQGILRDEAQRYQKDIQARDRLIAELANNYAVTGYSGVLSDTQVARFLKVLQAKRHEMEKELQQKRAAQEEQEGEIQIEIDELRSNKTKLETELSIKQDTLSKNQTQIRDIKRELSSVEASADHLKVITRDLKKVERELGEVEKSVDLVAIKAEIKTATSEKIVMDGQLKSIDDELNRLSRESTGRAQLEHYKKDKTTKQESARKLKSKIGDSAQHLLGNVPTENFRRPLDQSLSKLGRHLRNTNEQLQRLKQEKTQKDTQCKMQREILTTKERDVRGYQDRLSAVSGSQNFDAGLDQLQESLKKAQDDKGNLKGVEYMYKKYQDNLHKEDPPCPLCHRPFDNHDEVEDLINEIQQKMNMVPGKLERAAGKIDQYKGKVEEMLQLKPIRAAMMDLENDDIPSLKMKIQVLAEQIDKLQEDLNDKEDEVETVGSDEKMCQMIQSDATLIDQLHNELRDLDKKITHQASLLSGGDNDRSMQDVQEEREELRDKIEMVDRNLDRKRQKLSEQSEHIQSLRASENKLNSQKLQLEKGLQQRTRLEDNKLTLESSNENLVHEIKDGKTEIRPLQESIHDKEKQKMKVTRIKEGQYEEGMKQVNGVNEEQQKLTRHNDNIESYVQSGKEKDLEQSTGQIEKVERKAAKLAKKKEEITSQIDQIKEDLAMQKMRERELSDNLMVYQKQDEIKILQDRISSHQEKLGGLDVNNLHTELQEKEAKKERYIKEKLQAESRKIGFEQIIKNKKGELKEDTYKDAEEKYRDMMIAHRTTELAQKDLDKYYKALDRTIMSYHSTKMTDINKIIRELWRNTYKGNDIETIEIRSDEDEASGASKTRRIYNYRVVSIRSGVSIDMRNRCSAGQKVLASLIIRLALAETFCINCGILALDEPTTNLDRENIESLAYALVEIIKSRSKQRNFQLVIITHDEDFVELLGRSDYVEEFFKVRKNEDGCSRLVRARVQDLHSR